MPEGYRSIHGRKLGLTSTGGLGQYLDYSGGGSSAVTLLAQTWGPAMVETISSAGAVIRNAGITIISSDSTQGTTPFLFEAPVIGLHKEVHFQTSATTLVLNTTATTIKFNSTLAELAASGSTVLTVTGPTAGIGGVMSFRGLSTAIWAVINHTVAYSS